MLPRPLGRVRPNRGDENILMNTATDDMSVSRELDTKRMHRKRSETTLPDDIPMVSSL